MAFRAICVILLVASAPWTASASSLTRFDGIKLLIEAKRTAEARTQLGQLLEEAHRERDSRKQGFCQMFLAITELTEGDLISTQSTLDQAGQTLEAAKDHISAALVFSALGSLEAELLRLDAAIAAHERALRVLHEHVKEPTLFDALPLLEPLVDSIGPSTEQVELYISDSYIEALLMAGEQSKAEAELDRMKERAVRQGSLYEASMLAEYGDLRRLQLRIDDARQSYLAAWRLGVASVNADVAIKMVDLEVLAGRHDAALEWNGKALTLARTARDARTEVKVLLQRAALSMESGRIADGDAAFTESLAITARTGDDYWRAGVLMNTAVSNMQRGRYREAIDNLMKSIDLMQKVKRPDVEAFLLCMLSVLNNAVGDGDLAYDTVMRARSLAEAAKIPLALHLADFLISLRGKLALPGVAGQYLIWMSAGSADNAEDPLAKVSAFGDQVRGIMLLRKGDHAGARAALEASANNSPSADLQAMSQALIAESYTREGKTRGAIDAYARAVDALEEVAGDLKIEELVANYLGTERFSSYEELIGLLVAEQRFAEAYTVSERARSRAFLSMVGNGRINPFHDSELAGRAEMLRRLINGEQSGAP